jgi:hypothetical protein
MVHNKTTPPHPSVSVLQNMEMTRPESDCTKVNEYKTYVTKQNYLKESKHYTELLVPLPSTGSWVALH